MASPGGPKTKASCQRLSHGVIAETCFLFLAGKNQLGHFERGLRRETGLLVGYTNLFAQATLNLFGVGGGGVGMVKGQVAEQGDSSPRQVEAQLMSTPD